MNYFGIDDTECLRCGETGLGVGFKQEATGQKLFGRCDACGREERVGFADDPALRDAKEMVRVRMGA